MAAFVSPTQSPFIAVGGLMVERNVSSDPIRFSLSQRQGVLSMDIRRVLISLLQLNLD
jgi:hypothetical protein